jgi:hypothetical protein
VELERAHLHQPHLIPAPRVRAIDATSAAAQVRRARYVLTVSTSYTHWPAGSAAGRSGRPRSLALRPRLATGLPWTHPHGRERSSLRGRDHTSQGSGWGMAHKYRSARLVVGVAGCQRPRRGGRIEMGPDAQVPTCAAGAGSRGSSAGQPR